MQNFDNPTLARLAQGIKNFQQRFYEHEPEKMRHLVEHGQRPEVLLIACSDSRVDPAILTDAAPGDLFVLRNVANLVPPYLLDGKYDGARAAIEYAVRDLQVKHIVILGHAHCGGIKALLNSVTGQPVPQGTSRDFIGDWVSIAMDSCRHYVLNRMAGAEQADGDAVDMEHLRSHQYLVERAAIQGSLDNLATYPWIAERLERGDLSLHGWWFDIETGDLWATDDDHAHFLPVLD
jgi:carbonic anhydrase